MKSTFYLKNPVPGIVPAFRYLAPNGKEELRAITVKDLYAYAGKRGISACEKDADFIQSYIRSVYLEMLESAAEDYPEARISKLREKISNTTFPIYMVPVSNY